MANWKLHLLRFAVCMLILQGISSLWEFIDVATYGESQRSAADAIAAVVMTDWICRKIWGKDNA